MKSITEYGIIANSNEMLTDKIQFAIDECAKNGKTLVFSEGTYKTGTLFLRNNTKIKLEKGAVIKGSTSMEDYPDTEASFVDAVGQIRGKTLILTYNSENIEVFGEGEIYGSGESFDDIKRPFLVRIIKSKNVKFDGVKLSNSAAWCLHLNDSEHIDIKNITIDSHVNENNDGIDIDGSKYVNIENCDIVSGDDAICLKTTTLNSCEYVSVKNCRIKSGWGGIKIGTESVGDISHIRVENCFLYDVLGGGIKIVPTDGSNVTDVYISDIKMENCTGPIFIVLGERLRRYAGAGRDTYSTLKDVIIKNINADVVKAPVRGFEFGEVWGNAIGVIIISGTKENMIENLTLKNIDAILPGGVTEYETKEVSYMKDKYPEFHRMDIVPAKGIYIRDVKGYSLENINLSFKEDDVRENIVYENVLAEI